MGNQVSTKSFEANYKTELQKHKDEMSKLVQEVMVKVEDSVAGIKQFVEQSNETIKTYIDESNKQNTREVQVFIEQNHEALKAKLTELKQLVETFKPKPKPPSKPRGFSFDHDESDQE